MADQATKPDDKVRLAGDNVQAARDGSGPGWRWLILIVLFGLVLTFVAKPVGDWLKSTRMAGAAELIEYGLEHLGVVIVVAMFIRGTLEAASQRDFVRVVNQEVKSQIERNIQTTLQPIQKSVNTLSTALTYRISQLFQDTPLRTMLEQSVLNPTFIRPVYSLHLALEPVKDPSGAPTEFVKVFVSFEYQVRNVSTAESHFPIYAWLEDVIRSAPATARDVPAFTRVAYGKEPPQVGVNVGELLLRKKIQQKEGSLELHVQSDAIGPNEVLWVEVAGMQLMRTEDHFVWNLTTLTQKLHVDVTFQGGLTLQAFRLWPHAMHHISHDDFQRLCKFDQNANTCTIDVDQVFLPYQGIEFRWVPVPPPPVPPAGSTTTTTVAGQTGSGVAKHELR
jgi:hypothetical protein